jgi:hypothetical protein
VKPIKSFKNFISGERQMNTISRYTSDSSQWFVIVAINLIAILMFSATAQANQHVTRIITGCDKGVVEKDDKYFPREAWNKVPYKMLQWDIGLNDGEYAIRITSWYDFKPFIFEMRGGKYYRAGFRQVTKRLKTRNGKYFYAIDFTANHMNSRGVNMWRLNMMPKDQYRTQTIRVIIKHKRCPKSTRDRLERPGEEDVDNPRPFGQNY